MNKKVIEDDAKSKTNLISSRTEPENFEHGVFPNSPGLEIH